MGVWTGSVGGQRQIESQAKEMRWVYISYSFEFSTSLISSETSVFIGQNTLAHSISFTKKINHSLPLSHFSQDFYSSNSSPKNSFCCKATEVSTKSFSKSLYVPLTGCSDHIRGYLQCRSNVLSTITCLVHCLNGSAEVTIDSLLLRVNSLHQ